MTESYFIVLVDSEEPDPRWSSEHIGTYHRGQGHIEQIYKVRDVIGFVREVAEQGYRVNFVKSQDPSDPIEKSDYQPIFITYSRHDKDFYIQHLDGSIH